MVRFGAARVLGCALLLALVPARSRGIEVNDDGRELIGEAAQAVRDDMKGRPTVQDPAFKTYVEGVARALVPKDKKLPDGVRLNATIVESRIPEVYSYVDGTVVITTGAVFAVDDEAQLATLLSHEVAHLVEGHYLGMYQAIKAAERGARRNAVVAGLLGTLVDSAVGYAMEVETARQYDRLFKGHATYLSTAESVAKLHAAKHAYVGIKDVIASIPEKDAKGGWVDPRQRFEVVADAQGVVYLAQAGYDAGEAPAAWSNVWKVHNEQALKKEKALGQFAAQMRESESMMRVASSRLRQSLGASGLVQTISDAPPSRSDLVAELIQMKEVRDAQKAGEGKKKAEEYRKFLAAVSTRKAEKALSEERYGEAEFYYRAMYEKGVREPAVAYGLAKSSIGDFAFSASDAQKREAQRLYLEAAAKDDRYALPYRGLGELYEDWERYGDAVKAYQGYVKRAPAAGDRKRIERKIETLKRKAAR